MGLQQLGLSTLGRLEDGKIELAFNQALKQVADDCYDRPGDKKPRTVQLICKVTPKIDQSGFCEETQVHFEVKNSVPTRRSRDLSMSLRKGGSLVFSEHSPTNVNQLAFDDIDPETGEIHR